MNERLNELKEKITTLWNDIPLKCKVGAALIIVCLLSSAISYNVGTSRNLSRELIAEKAAADEEYTQVVNLTEEQNEKLDELNAQISDAEAKIEDYSQTVEGYELEISDLENQIAEKQNAVQAETQTSGGSDTAPKAALSSESTVYVTKTGTKYHRNGCSSLSKSKIAMTLSDAVAKGYTPSHICN